MTAGMSLSIKEARRAILSHQGLWPPRAMRGWGDVSAYFSRVGSMQFDPVDVAGISPEISLCARVRGFRREMLGEWLYGERVLCDVWDKNACIASARDVADLLSNRQALDWGWRVRSDAEGLEKPTEAVAERLRAEGPLSTSAFRDNAAEREALERMLVRGDVVIHHREGRRRLFVLAEKFDGPPGPTARESDELDDWFVHRRVGALGLLWNRSSYAYIGIGGMDTAHRNAAFGRLEREGRIARIQVEGLRDPLFYRTGDEAMFSAQERPAKAALLGPLDNLMWDRALIRALFGFSYAWEVYVPQEKRTYGSYTMPLLYGDRFIGRMQLSCSSGALSVADWWPEENLRATKAMQREVHAALSAHAQMLGLRYDSIDIL